MLNQYLRINNIPALLWGEPSDKIIVAVHGNRSHKADAPMEILAEEATPRGYQVLSFDLPQHGERISEPILCKVEQCVLELGLILEFAAARSRDLSLFGCSMGAYFSLLATKQFRLRQSLFLSPIVDMAGLIDNLMTACQISKERLQAEREIPIPSGPTFYWDDYVYVRARPVPAWTIPAAILVGSLDELCPTDVIVGFARRFGCSLTVLDQGVHYFHTPEQLDIYRQWLKKHLQ